MLPAQLTTLYIISLMTSNKSLDEPFSVCRVGRTVGFCRGRVSHCRKPRKDKVVCILQTWGNSAIFEGGNARVKFDGDVHTSLWEKLIDEIREESGF
jgi:hypothetical protein